MVTGHLKVILALVPVHVRETELHQLVLLVEVYDHISSVSFNGDRLAQVGIGE
ncbi:MAG: hypothetical protein IPO56_16520 [Flavobacteriales bacterium]|nr:hypothetical protein [Flavobacteriales bacterium]